MASKEMAYLNIGNDEFEIVDEAGRQATEAVDEKAEEIELTVSQLSASNLPYSSTQSTKDAIDSKPNAWKYAGYRDMKNPQTGTWTLDVEDNLMAAKEFMFVFELGQVARQSVWNPVMTYGVNIGADLLFLNNFRVALVGYLTSRNTIEIITAVNGGATASGTVGFRLYYKM